MLSSTVVHHDMRRGCKSFEVKESVAGQWVQKLHRQVRRRPELYEVQRTAKCYDDDVHVKGVGPILLLLAATAVLAARALPPRPMRRRTAKYEREKLQIYWQVYIVKR